ncbi:MAG TPA: hypothetical protein VFN97_17315 [Actinospica sp.]|nr:hypothetical protein [Actinospica sp.]
MTVSETFSAWRTKSAETRGAAAGQRTLAGEPLRRLLLVSFGLACLAITLVIIAVANGPQISITDEPVHAAYLYDASHLQIPAKGDLTPREIRYEWYCHNLQADTGSSVCTGYDNSTFQTTSQIYTFGDPPVYYLVTGLLVRVISPVIPGTHNFITVGRDLGAMWLFAAMIVLYLAARRFRIGWPYALAAAALLPLCPGVLASTSQITSDAPAALCGALALYVLARILVDRRMGLVAPILATLFATGTKVLNGMPMLIVGGVTFFLALGVLYRDRRDWRSAVRPLAISAAIVATFGAVFLGWSRFQDGRGVANWVNPNAVNGSPLTGSKAGDLLSNLFGTFSNLTTAYWLPDSINGESVSIWATLLCVVLVGAPLMVVVASRARSWGWVLGVGTFAGIALVVPAVEAQVYLANHQFFLNVAPRYALTFLPWAIICLAVVAYRRRLLRSTFLFVSLGVLVLLLAETQVLTLGPALVGNAKYLVG